MDWRAYYIERAEWAREKARLTTREDERREWLALAAIYDQRASEPPPDKSVH
jgi:pyruvate-formate lyase